MHFYYASITLCGKTWTNFLANPIKMPEELRAEFHNIKQEVIIKIIPKKKKWKKRQKWLSQKGWQRLRKEEKQKAKEKRSDISIWMQSSKEEQGERRKTSWVINAKKLGKTIEWERLETSSRKSKIPRGHSKQRLDNKGQKQYGPNRSRRWGGKNTQKNKTKGS